MAKEWRCFHCDDVFTEWHAARDHFGATLEGLAACVIKAGEERGLLMALRRTEQARDQFRQQRDTANDEVDALGSQLSAWETRFPGCRTAQDLFNKYDSMEGRALAAEERIAAMLNGGDCK